MSTISVYVCVLFFISVFGDVSAAKHEPRVKFFELNKGNFSVKFTNRGATIVSVILPDKRGKLADVVLGFDSVEQYANNTQYFGAIVGRVGNRIGGARFTLNRTTYKLIANDGNNTLHGGYPGFGDIVWTVRKYKRSGHVPYITFTHQSFDGEQRFPGDLVVSVTYKLLGNQQLSVNMKAVALNKATPVNIIQHAYWNLRGHNTGDILSHKVQIFGSHITPTDHNLIPTGEIVTVKDTPYDFLKPQTVGSRINKVSGGYNNNYVVDGPQDQKMKKIAVVYEEKSGRMMTLWSDKPGVQFYTSGSMPDIKGKGGFVYRRYAALCLETQGFPDSVNHPNFPSVIVNPRKAYTHNMLFQFSRIYF
ncbi:aldose 1-epimerase [Ranunculus cassubicifolius]